MCAVLTCSSLRAAADVGVFSVLAGASVPARQAQTLVDVGFTESAGVSRSAVAAEGGQAVDAGAIVAGVGVTLVDVRLAVPPSVTCQKGVFFFTNASSCVNFGQSFLKFGAFHRQAM